MLLDARTLLVGDSLWSYWLCADNLRYHDVTVVCNRRNIGVFEFFRDFLWNCENLQVTLDIGRAVAEPINAGPWNREQQFYFSIPPLDREDGLVYFQPESRAHGKANLGLNRLSSIHGGYSIGVEGERILHNTLAYHSHSISSVAALILASRGMIGTFSSMSLLASLLGKKVVVVNYEGGSIPAEAAGFPSPRCRIVNSSDPEEIARVANEHLGPCVKVR